jgi:nucleotide-binding universal stress UspA family protein
VDEEEAMMFSSIVIGIDGSENSLKALKYARQTAEKFQAKLIIVHAYPRTSDLHDFEGYEKLVARRKSDGRKIIDQAQALLADAALEIEEELLEDPADEAILAVAGTWRADLIVVGTRGMGAVKSVFFGSIATKVIHKAECPVLIVR